MTENLSSGSTACRPPQRHHNPPSGRFYSRLPPSHAAALTRRYALRYARLNSNGSKALPDIAIAMQYMTRHKWRSCNKFGSRILFFFPCTRWFTYSRHRCHAHIPILLILLSTAVPPQHSTLHLHTAVAHSSGIAPVGNLYCRSSCF